jgi:hypothetical protein
MRRSFEENPAAGAPARGVDGKDNTRRTNGPTTTTAGQEKQASGNGHEPKTPMRALADVLEIARRWPIFPCNPLNKKPLTDRGFKDATQHRRNNRDGGRTIPMR